MWSEILLHIITQNRHIHFQSFTKAFTIAPHISIIQFSGLLFYQEIFIGCIVAHINLTGVDNNTEMN